MKAVYNNIMKRWLYGRDADLETLKSSSLVFKEGYDDPTYMTFKIEFGDWGASVLDRKLIQAGTTVFRPSMADYDALPIGLLNCPADGDRENNYWQNGAADDNTIFNNTNLYSAFAYLRSRNEDTRAKYLYYFVNGLFEIQKNYPFLFKKISGLNELEKMDSLAGQRLKTPAKITVECFESLNLKIRTLMEFYRKAAWDDVYQRWVLPENMREFKMIIYVFERRVFQTPKKISDNYVAMEYSDLNADIPVKAYECCPCEFSISDSNSWGNDYEAGWTNNTEESSKLVINVKNVKTYFKNGLLQDTLSKTYDKNGKSIYDGNSLAQKIDSIMIYDLVDSIERTKLDITSMGGEQTNSNAYSNLTVNGAKALFLNKNILLENEEADVNIKSYIWGYSEIGANSDASNLIDTAKRKILYNKSSALSTPLNHPEGSLIAQDKNDLKLISAVYKLMDVTDNEIDQNDNSTVHLSGIKDSITYTPIEDNFYYRGGWMFAGQMPSYDPNKSFLSNLGQNILDTLVGTNKLILISGAADIMHIPYCLYNTYYLPPYTYDPIIEYDNGLGKNKVKNPSIGSRNIDEQTFNEIKSERKLIEQDFKELDKERDLPKQNYDELNPERTLPIQTYKDLSPERSLPIQSFTTLSPERILKPQVFDNLSSRTVPPQSFNDLSPERVLPTQSYSDLSPERKLPEQKYKDIDDVRKLPEQKYKDLENPRELPKQDFKELDKERDINTELINLILIARKLPAFKNITLEEARSIPEVDLLKLKDAINRSIPSVKADRSVLLEEISKIAGSNNVLLSLDTDNISAENKALEILKQNSALSIFKSPEINEDDQNAKKLKNIVSFTKKLTENSDEIKKIYIESVLAKKEKLTNVTKDIVNKLPINDTYIVKKGEVDTNSINSVLASQNDIEQINHNMNFIAIKDSDVEKLSFKTLITLQDDLNTAIEQSEAITGLTEITKNSVATNPDKKFRENAKNSVIEEPKKDKMTIIY